MHYMNSVESMMQPLVLAYIQFTLLAYTPEQICLPNCTYLSNFTTTVVLFTDPHITAYFTQKSTICNINYHTVSSCVPAINHMLHICYVCKLVDMHIQGKHIDIYAT